MRTLILDDDPVYLAVAEGVLSSLGIHDVQPMQKGAEALSAISQADPPFELVLLDLNMPDFDGLAFLRALAEIHYGGGVILVSGERKAILSSANHIAGKLGLKIHGALKKPMQLGDMREALEKAKGDERGRPPAFKIQHRAPAGSLTPMLHYQPQMSMRSREIVGAEALLRCGTHDGLVLGPEPLLQEYASETGRLQLTENLFDILCRDILMLQRQAGWDQPISFNIDARVFERDDLAAILIKMIGEHGVDAHQITLELTEAQLPSDPTRLLEVIARLGMAGFGLSLDDFGTGASNFELLREGAFSEVKLDKSIVHAAASGEGLSQKYLGIAADLARSLDIRLVAEGIENEGDIRYMEQFGIEVAQGYYFSRPVPIEEFMQVALGYSKGGQRLTG